MLISYSVTWAPKSRKADFYEMGNYQILFYFTHVIIIIIVANTVFWLKDIDPRFREGEDSSFEDIPSLVEHNQKRLQKQQGDGGDNNDGLLGLNKEKERVNYLIENIKGDVVDLAHEVKDKATGFFKTITGGRFGGTKDTSTTRDTSHLGGTGEDGGGIDHEESLEKRNKSANEETDRIPSELLERYYLHSSEQKTKIGGIGGGEEIIGSKDNYDFGDDDDYDILDKKQVPSTIGVISTGKLSSNYTEQGDDMRISDSKLEAAEIGESGGKRTTRKFSAVDVGVTGGEDDDDDDFNSIRNPVLHQRRI